MISSTMHSRIIPSSGAKLPVIGVGTYKGFDIGTNKGERAIRDEVLRSLFSMGGSVIDSSPMYGRAEGVVGDLLTGAREHEKAFVATKVWTEGKDAGVNQMRHSLELLQQPAIDLMQVHNLVDWRNHLATLREWKQEGLIKYLGVTHYTSSAYGELEKIMRAETLDFVQLNYSLDDREAERKLLPLAEERGMAILVNLPFGQGRVLGRLRGKPVPTWIREIGCETWPQTLLKFVLAHKAVTCVIPGTAKPEHMAENCRAGIGTMMDDALRRKLIAHWDGGLR